MEWIFVFPFILIGIGGLVLWIWALVDAIKVPDESMFRSGNRIIWVLVIILTGFIGAIIYLVVGRPSDADRAGRPLATPPMPPPPPGSLG
jgi:hypothetical protein